MNFILRPVFTDFLHSAYELSPHAEFTVRAEHLDHRVHLQIRAGSEGAVKLARCFSRRMKRDYMDAWRITADVWGCNTCVYSFPEHVAVKVPLKLKSTARVVVRRKEMPTADELVTRIDQALLIIRAANTLVCADIEIERVPYGGY